MVMVNVFLPFLLPSRTLRDFCSIGVDVCKVKLNAKKNSIDLMLICIQL